MSSRAEIRFGYIAMMAVYRIPKMGMERSDIDLSLYFGVRQRECYVSGVGVAQKRGDCKKVTNLIFKT